MLEGPLADVVYDAVRVGDGGVGGGPEQPRGAHARQQVLRVLPERLHLADDVIAHVAHVTLGAFSTSLDDFRKLQYVLKTIFSM